MISYQLEFCTKNLTISVLNIDRIDLFKVFL